MLHCTNEFFCLFFVFFLPLLGNMLLIEISLKVLNLSGHLFDGTGLHCGLQSLGLRNCHDSYVQFSTNNQKKIPLSFYILNEDEMTGKQQIQNILHIL